MPFAILLHVNLSAELLAVQAPDTMSYVHAYKCHFRKSLLFPAWANISLCIARCSCDLGLTILLEYQNQ